MKVLLVLPMMIFAVLLAISWLGVGTTTAYARFPRTQNVSGSSIHFGPRDPFAYMVDNTYNTHGVAPDKGMLGRAGSCSTSQACQSSQVLRTARYGCTPEALRTIWPNSMGKVTSRLPASLKALGIMTLRITFTMLSLMLEGPSTLATAAMLLWRLGLAHRQTSPLLQKFDPGKPRATGLRRWRHWDL